MKLVRIIEPNPKIFLNQKKEILDYENTSLNEFQTDFENENFFVFCSSDFLEVHSSSMENYLQYLFLEFEGVINANEINIYVKDGIDTLFFDFYKKFIQECFVQNTPELENNLDFDGALNYCTLKENVPRENIPYKLWVIEKREILVFLYDFVKPNIKEKLELEIFLSFFNIIVMPEIEE